MANPEGFRIRSAVSIDTEATRDIEQAAAAKRWGVFEHRYGMVRLDSMELQSVWEEQQVAEAEAARLEETEAECVLEIDSDPESNIWSANNFFVEEIVLRGVHMVAEYTYSRQAPQDQPQAY